MLGVFSAGLLVHGPALLSAPGQEPVAIGAVALVRAMLKWPKLGTAVGAVVTVKLCGQWPTTNPTRRDFHRTNESTVADVVENNIARTYCAVALNLFRFPHHTRRLVAFCFF